MRIDPFKLLYKITNGKSMYFQNSKKRKSMVILITYIQKYSSSCGACKCPFHKGLIGKCRASKCDLYAS